MRERGSDEGDSRLGDAVGASERSQPPRDRMAPRRRVQCVAGCGQGTAQRSRGIPLGESLRRAILREVLFVTLGLGLGSVTLSDNSKQAPSPVGKHGREQARQTVKESLHASSFTYYEKLT